MKGGIVMTSFSDLIRAQKLISEDEKRIEVEIEEIETRGTIRSPTDENMEDIFLATYLPYIRNPYSFNFFHHRDYYSFLLGDIFYTINLFPPINKDLIFLLYQEILEPKSLSEYQRLTYFCSHIGLNVPALFQNRIVAEIKRLGKIKNLDKKSEKSYTFSMEN